MDGENGQDNHAIRPLTNLLLTVFVMRKARISVSIVKS